MFKNQPPDSIIFFKIICTPIPYFNIDKTQKYGTIYINHEVYAVIYPKFSSERLSCEE